MAQSLKIVAWNANDLCQHMNKVKIFIFNNQIDITLISETHLTKKHYFKIPSYLIYHTTYPDGITYDGTAIIIKNNIRNHEIDNFNSDFLQAIIVELED
jgi:exonuclease III